MGVRSGGEQPHGDRLARRDVPGLISPSVRHAAHSEAFLVHRGTIRYAQIACRQGLEQLRMVPPGASRRTRDPISMIDLRFLARQARRRAGAPGA
jgi:hypothetical protein